MAEMFKPTFAKNGSPIVDRKQGDYDRNLAYAEKFIEKMQGKLPMFVKISFDTTNHQPPRKMLLFNYRRRMPKVTPRGVVGGGYSCGSPTYANHIALDDNHSEFLKNFESTLHVFKQISEKYGDKIFSWGDNDSEKGSTKEALCQKMSSSSMYSKQSDKSLSLITLSS